MAIPTDGQQPEELVRVQDLVVHYPVRSGVFRRISAWIKAVDGVSFSIREGETLGLVGESGCGKSTVGRAMLRLKDPTGGKVMFNGVDILKLPTNELKPIRRNMQIVFQDPYSSLNPRKPVADAILAGLKIHKVGAIEERYPMVIDALQRVGLGTRADDLPANLSGGQKQRVAIARALFNRPPLLLCDEPTGNLDTHTGQQIIELFTELNRDDGISLVIVTHESRVSTAAHRVIRLEDGCVTEADRRIGVEASTDERRDAETP